VSPSASPTGSKESRLDALIEGLSVEEKVGQLFMPVLYGPRADSDRKENRAQFGPATPEKIVERYRPGGVILFPWAGNISGVAQLVGLINGVQEASPGIPLLIGTDQENGLVSRLGRLVTKLPGAKTIGDTGDPGEARAAARVTGEEMRALGFNLDFAPVADVNVNPKNPIIGPRAYGSDPGKVAKMVGAAIDGFHDAGVASTAKHFPGHGDTSVDSHTGLPVIQHSPSQWEKVDAPPFRAAIAHGVDAIMSAHLEMPKLDGSGDPATLSKPILTGLLREKLGFDGVVVTDSLQMQGVREKYGDGEVAVRAILAGADILLMPPDFAKAYEAVLAAAESGRIPAERLDQSVRRILRLKTTRGLFGAKPADPDKAAKILKSDDHRKVARRITRRSA
jgi:beta-N-acetylhexosaminidase